MKKADFCITPMSLGEKSCNWCESNAKIATYKIWTESIQWMDYACEEHYQKYFNNGHPTLAASHKVGVA